MISDETEEPKASHMQGGSLEARCLHITVDSNIKVWNLKWEEKDLQKTKTDALQYWTGMFCYEKFRLQLNLQENTPFLWLHN